MKSSCDKYIPITVLLILIYCLYDPCSLLAIGVVKFFHFVVALFILFGPLFIVDKILLEFYILVVIFISFHWYLSSDICAITLIEQAITGRNCDEAFVGKVVKPIYNIEHKLAHSLTYLVLFIAIIKYIYLYYL